MKEAIKILLILLTIFILILMFFLFLSLSHRLFSDMAQNVFQMYRMRNGAQYENLQGLQ